MPAIRSANMGNWSGIPFGIRSAADPEARPLYRKYSPATGTRLLTTDINEAPSFTNEGVIGCIGKQPVPGMGKKVWRLYAPQTDDHYYTASAEYRDMRVMFGGWYVEGEIGYAW